MTDELEVQPVEDVSEQPLSTPTENVEQEDLSLRGNLQKALTEAKEREAEKEKDKPSRSRDETGKFAKKEQPEIEVPVESLKTFTAPESWNAQAKEKFKALAPEIQEIIAKREEEIHKGLTRHDEERMFGKQLKEVITPYMPIINSQGLQPAQAVQALMNADYQLRTSSPANKVQYFRQLAQHYGIDLSQISPAATYVDPQVAMLERRQRDIEEMLQREKQQKQQEQQVAIQAEIDAFASNPAYPHFNAVKAHMGALLQSGLAKDLKDAYEQAVYARHDTRSTLLAEQQKEAEAKRLADIKNKSTAARNVAVSVTGAPGPASKKVSPERGLREELRANLRAATS